MSIKALLAATCATVVLTATSAIAKDSVLPGDDGFTTWGEAGGWTVFVDNERKSCLIERMDENKNVVQVGLTKKKEYAYVGVFTKTDIGLKSGKEKVFISLDGVLYEGKAHKKTKHLTEGYTGGYILADNPEFIADFANKYKMVVFPEKDFAFVVNLDGTKKAVEAGIQCNLEQ